MRRTGTTVAIEFAPEGEAIAGFVPMEPLLTSRAGCGGRVDGPSVEKAFALSEERFCPVWVMLKASVPITAKFHILAD